MLRADENGDYYIFDSKVEKSMWYNMRVEVAPDKTTKFYLNGTLIFEHDPAATSGRPTGLWSGKNDSPSYGGRVNMNLNGTKTGLTESISIDNVYVDFN